MLSNINVNALVKAHDKASKWLWDGMDVRAHNVIIAGGFLRDMYNCKPVKDIDVFTTCPFPEQRRSEFNFTQRHMAADNCEHYDRIVGFKYLQDVTVTVEGTPFNFVFFDDNATFDCRKLITGFDYTNCMIGFDGYAVEMDKRFMLDCRDKVLRRVNDTIGNLEARKARMQEKYPDWRFVDETEDF